MSAGLRDARGEPASAAGAQSLRRLETVLDQLLSFRGNPSAGLKALLADDPDCVLARCMKIAFLLYQHQRVLGPRLRQELDAADAVRANPRERAQLAALRLWAEGRLNAAADGFERLLLDHPRDLLALKFAQDLRFFLGQGPRIRDGVARLLPHWTPELPGYGYLLGMYAFGLEECADYARAEDAARHALTLNRFDAWAVHAGAHVFEMRGEREQGLRWLGEREDDWSRENFFAVHQRWHQSLYLYDLARYPEILTLYDREIGPRAGDLVLNRVDASAALWRLHLADVDTGERAAALAEVWAPEAANAVSAFNDSHALMAFVLAGRNDEAEALLGACRQAAEGDVDNAVAARRAGLDCCLALAAFGRGDYAGAVELLLPIRYALPVLGGSHAQRDVYALTLIEAALRADHGRLATALLAERRAERRNSEHDRSLQARAAAVSRL